MVSITSFITTVASIAAIASAFKLEVDFPGSELNSHKVGLNRDKKLIIGKDVKPVDFSYADKQLFVTGTKKIVYQSNINGLATAVEPDLKYPWDQINGYAIKDGELIFRDKPAKAEKLKDGTYAIHFEYDLPMAEDWKKISIKTVD